MRQGSGGSRPQKRADRAPPHGRRTARIRRWCGERPKARGRGRLPCRRERVGMAAGGAAAPRSVEDAAGGPGGSPLAS